MDFKKLLDQTPLFVPQVDNVEDTHFFGIQTVFSEYNYDDDSFVKLPYICGLPLQNSVWQPNTPGYWKTLQKDTRPMREEWEQQEADVRFKNDDPKDPAVPCPGKPEDVEVPKDPGNPNPEKP